MTAEPTTATTERSLTITWEDPRALAAKGAEMAGLDRLRAVADGTLPAPPIARLLGMRLAEVEEGRAVFEVEPGEQHYNPIGVVHGGLAATLCDSAMGCAVQSALPVGVAYTTLELKVNLVRALTVESGTVRCEGTLIHLGGRVATAEARLYDGAGRLCAHATTTCMVIRP
jgi:uncharacterized protein (TIGR00369 family)